MKKLQKILTKVLGLTLVVVIAATIGIGCQAAAAETTAAAAETTAAAAETTAAAAETTAAAETLTIGRVMMEYGHPYQQADMTHFAAYGDEIGVETIVLDGKSSPDVISNAVDDLISRGVDGIIFQPVDEGSSNNVLQACLDAGIPAITFFQRPNTVKAPHVRINETQTSFEMGALAAQKMGEFFPGEPIKIGCVEMATIEYVVVNRTDAFIEGVQSVAPEAEVLARLDGAGLRDQAFEAGQDLLQSHPEVNLVFGSNADDCLGALAAFELAGRGKAVDTVPVTEMFISIDGSEGEALKMIDPTSALKITMALTPLPNAKVLMDTILSIVNGEMGMTDDVIVDVPDLILNYYDMGIEELQDFITGQYLSEVDLKTEFEKLSK